MNKKLVTRHSTKTVAAAVENRDYNIYVSARRAKKKGAFEYPIIKI